MQIRSINGIVAVGLMLILSAGCGNSGPGTFSSNTQETGKIALSLDWSSNGKPTSKTVSLAPAGVATVRIIIAGSGISPAIQHDFAASAGTGTIDGIPAGTGRTMTAQGLDSSGAVAYQGITANITITAGHTTAVGPVTMIAAPAASFTVAPTAPVVCETVIFTDTSTNSPTSWLWDFGDSTTSTLQNPAHVYTIATPVTVTLTATNATGSNSTAKSMTINPLTYSISGAVTANSTALAGVTLTLTGGTTATTNSSGAFNVTGVQPGSYTITPSLSGYSFSPSSSSFIVGNGNVTGLNFSATNNGSITITW